ncbi:MAG: 50S ribosomal protein L4 [Minisyncoccia bacterium]
MKLDLYNLEGEKIGKIEINGIFDKLKKNDALIHQVVRWQILNSYYPFAHTKTRGEVRGGGRKPWPQKHTGRARHGSIRSPIWKGGGVVFGPRKEEIKKIKINKKMKRKAILMVLKEKMKNGFVKILENLNLKEYKTKEANKIFEKFLKKRKTKKKMESALLIIPENNKKLVNAIRNLPYANVIEARNLNVLALLNHKYIFTIPETFDIIKKTFKIND